MIKYNVLVYKWWSGGGGGGVGGEVGGLTSCFLIFFFFFFFFLSLCSMIIVFVGPGAKNITSWFKMGVGVTSCLLS